MPKTNASFRSKKESALSILARQGVKSPMIQPLFFRGAWALGIELPPPHFASFSVVAAINGAYFALVWGVAMWLVSLWSGQQKPFSSLVATALSAGVIFGVTLASLYRSSSRKHQVPAWDAVPLTPTPEA